MAKEVCQGIDAGGLHFKVGDMGARNALSIEAVHSFCEYTRGANGASLWGVEAWKGSGDTGSDVGDSRNLVLAKRCWYKIGCERGSFNGDGLEVVLVER